MSMQSSDPILAQSRGSARRAIGYLSAPDETDRDLVRGLFRWGERAGVDAAIAVAQAFHETANLTSIRWIRDRNSAVIGITTRSALQPFVIPDGDAAARLQIQCLYALVMNAFHPEVPLWAEAEQWLRANWLDRKVLDPAFPPVRVIGDLHLRFLDSAGQMQATWSCDEAYSHRLITKGNDIFGHTLDGKELTVPKRLPAAPNLEQAMIPAGNVNRSGLEMASPSFITLHEVGAQDPAIDAAAFRDLLLSGGGEDGASYHFVVGADQVVQVLPLDEAAWHAGDGLFGPGNRDSVGIAIVQSGDFDRALSRAAWLVAEIIEHPGGFVSNQPRAWDFSSQRIRRHGHWASGAFGCAQIIEEQRLWPELMRRVEAYLARCGQRSAWPQPLIPEFMTDDELARGIDRRFGDATAYALRRLWFATRDTPRLQHAGPDAPELGPPIRRGESFIGEFIFRSQGEWFVLTRWGARVRMDDLEPQIELKVA
jgi:N-acetylmuramoyl-L-alanine amidase